MTTWKISVVHQHKSENLWLHRLHKTPENGDYHSAIKLYIYLHLGTNIYIYVCASVFRPSRCCQPVRKRLMCPTQRAMNSSSPSSKKAWRIPHMRQQPITKWPRLVWQAHKKCFFIVTTIWTEVYHLFSYQLCNCDLTGIFNLAITDTWKSLPGFKHVGCYAREVCQGKLKILPGVFQSTSE